MASSEVVNYQWMNSRTTFSKSGKVTSESRTPQSRDVYHTRTESAPQGPDHRSGKTWIENQGKRIIITDHHKSSFSSLTVGNRTGNSTIIYDQNSYYASGELSATETGKSVSVTFNRVPPGNKLSDPRVLEKIESLKAAAHNHAIALANKAAWDVATFLAEAPETVAYIGDKLIGVYDFLRRKGRPNRHQRRPKGSIGEGSDRWLEYRYALTPMALDVQNMLSALNFQELYFRTSRGTETGTEVFVEEKRPLSYVKITETSTVNIRCNSCVYTIFSESQQRALQYAVFIPTAVWEKVTLSFVLDWFIQVGDLILALRPVEYIQRSMTDSVKLVQSSSSVYEIMPLWQNTSTNTYSNFQLIGSDTAVSYYDSYDRVVAPINPVIPSVNVKLNWRRCLDAFALSWPSIRRGLSHAKKWF